MPEALRREEVDALLSLAKNLPGAASASSSASNPRGATAEPRTRPDLDSGSSPEPFTRYNTIPAHQINIYDFKRPERVSKSQVVALEALHEVFARNVSASLSAYLRTIIEVRLVSVEQFTYSEFTMSLPTPTSFNLLSCEPLEGHIILEVNPSIIFPIIDRLLGGGSAEVLYLDRPFTSIENGLLNTILGRIIEELRETWENVKEIDFRIYETESNPFLLQIVPPNEPIVLLSFETMMGDYSGMVNLCIPFKVIEPIMPEFSQSSWFGATGRRAGQDGENRILDNMQDAEVELAGILAQTPLSLADILSLRPGDIIDTGVDYRSPVILTVEGRGKFRGIPLAGRRKRIEILEVIEESGRDFDDS